jgi:hypothetical protein
MSIILSLSSGFFDRTRGDAMDTTDPDEPVEGGPGAMKTEREITRNPEGGVEPALEHERNLRFSSDVASGPEEGLRLDDDESEGLAVPLARLSASEALDRLRLGQVLRNVRIERLVFQGEFASPVRLDRVVLVRPHFKRASFKGDVEMTHCTLNRPRFDGRTSFAKGWNLRGSTIVHACIRSVTVAGTFRCDSLKSRGRLLVADSRFEGPVRFWEARFDGWVEFKEVFFAACADFRSLHADQGFVLSSCQFSGDFLFRGSTVSKKWEAAGSRFDGLLDLSKAKLHDFAYLENIEQGPNQQFAFQNAVAERLLIRTDQLEGRLASERAGDYAGAMSEYGFLKRVFEGLHRYDQEDWVFYRFKINQRRCRPHSWRRPWTELARFCDWLLLDLGCGYGTNPMRAVVAALVLILGFALVYMVSIGSLHVEHLPFEGPETNLPNRVMIGLTTSVSAFTSGFGDLRDVAKGGIMNLLLIAESLLGTLLWGLFIVAFGRKVIR